MTGSTLHIQAGKKQLRKAPPRPEFRCQDYLEAVEERYKRSILTDYEHATGVDHCRLPVCFALFASACRHLNTL